MTTIVVDTLQSDNGTLQIADGTQLDFGTDGALVLPGSVVNFSYIEYDGRTGTSCPNNNHIVIPQMQVELERKVAGSSFHIAFMVNGECTSHDHALSIHRRKNDGSWSLLGYNTDVGVQRWSGVNHGWYDRDENSTPYNMSAIWFDNAPSNSTYPVGTRMQYTVGTRSSNSGNRTFWINRTDSRIGQNAYENMVSSGYVMEIAP
mgnify:CR=1 FL=1